MAYRRRQGIARATTFKEEIYHQPHGNDFNDDDVSRFKSSPSFSSANSSLAAQAIRASAAHRHQLPRSQGFNAYEDGSKNESKGFWGILAHKAKAILDDDNVSQQFGVGPSTDGSAAAQFHQLYLPNEGFRKVDSPTLRKSLDKLTSSLNQIGDTFEKAFDEGRTIVENETANIIQETCKLQIRQKGTEVENQASGGNNSSCELFPMQPTQKNQTTHQTQLKASRDVAVATAAKAKLLLRELKTVKADLAFAKERCAQLEEENRRLRENREKGSNPADDDMIRLQLETLLAEKARLAHENSIYARENRFLREIVEYHQLTMQDVVYIDEGIEEVTEVYPCITRTLSVTPPLPISPTSPSDAELAKEVYPVAQHPPQGATDVSANDTPPSSEVCVSDNIFGKGGPSQASA